MAKLAAVGKSSIFKIKGREIYWGLGCGFLSICMVIPIIIILSEDQVRPYLLGSGIGVISNLYAMVRVFAKPAKSSGDLVLVNLYRAEVGKLIIIGVLSAIVFAFEDDLQILGFLLGLFVTLMASVFGVIIREIIGDSELQGTKN